nr:DUF6441 family protein [Paracoccus litorisediminis]
MESQIDAAERGITRGIREAGEGLKTDWRGQVIGAGLGKRLANTVRARGFPSRGQSIGAASLVFSRAPVVVDAHDRGALIRSDRGLWLAIPISEVGRMRGFKGLDNRPGQRITPAGWERRTGRRLRFVYRKGKPSLLIDDGTKLTRDYGTPTDWHRDRGKSRVRAWKPIFLLVPQAKLRKKMELDRATEAWEARLPGAILKHWRDVGHG